MMHAPRISRSALAWLALLASCVSACAGQDRPGTIAPGDVLGDSTGVAVELRLDAPAWVTLVVEDADGRRVRNLVMSRRLAAGTHVVRWNGTTDGRIDRADRDRAGGRYRLAPAAAPAGRYRIRGLRHDGVALRYAMPLGAGRPPWHTRDGSGAWLADHTPPTALLALPEGSPYGPGPQVLAAAPVAEAGHALMWLDGDGRKLGGRSVDWEGAHALARDGADVYAVSVRQGRHVSLMRHHPDGTVETFYTRTLDRDYAHDAGVGLSARDGVVAFSLPLHDRVVFVDATWGRVLGEATLPRPRGLSVDASGRLLAATADGIARARVDWPAGTLADVDAFSPLRDVHALALDADGRVYAGVWGEQQHGVVVLEPDGRERARIGMAGPMTRGPYDAATIREPAGLAVDGEGRLWVAEQTFLKRISVWDAATGRLARAFYGPPKYGGGGVLDPRDSTRVVMASSGRLPLEREEVVQGSILFALDWDARTATPVATPTLRRVGSPEALLPGLAPEQPVYAAGRRYLVNTFGQAFHGMKSVVGIWLWDDAAQRADLVSVVGYRGGNPNHFWSEVEPVRPGTRGRRGRGQAFFVWSDLDRDGAVDAVEVAFRATGRAPGAVLVDDDLSVATSFLDRVAPPTIRDDGVPVYDLDTWTSAGEPATGDADVLTSDDGWMLHVGGPITGVRDGIPRWHVHPASYRRARAPDDAPEGALLETGRVIGYPFEPRGGEAGPMWALNSDRGAIYLFTTDGLLVHRLGGDARRVSPLRDPALQPGQLVPEPFSFGEESFWPSITQLEESGSVYVSAGKEYAALFRVEGLERVARIDLGTVQLDAVAPAPVRAAPDRRTDAEVLRIHAAAGPLRADGRLDEWAGASWVTLDAARGVQAAVAVRDGRMAVAYRTSEPDLLDNSLARGLPYLFATGGALEVLVGVRPEGRSADVQPGDQRLVVSREGHPRTGAVRAVLFEPASPRERDPQTYRSPLGETRIARVTDVGRRVEVGQEGGVYEVVFPLALLRLRPEPGALLRADLGVTRGDGVEARSRSYWASGAGAEMADLPAQARLEPAAWGRWRWPDRSF